MPEKRDFTDRFLKSLPPAAPGKRVMYYDSAVPGFGIRVTSSACDADKGAFVLLTRFPGSPNPTPRRIGDYPAMPLAKARAIAREWREDIARGIDPKVKEVERQRQEARRRADTFEVAFRAFADDHLSTLRTGAVVRATVESRIYPAWKDLPLTSIRRADVQDLIRGIRKTAPIQANRVLAYLKKFFAWAVEQDMLEASPAVLVKKPAKENSRDRVLNEFEIRAFWEASGELGVFGELFRLLLLLGQRRGEVAGMTWAEIDTRNKLWSLGRDRTKAARAHEVPLPDLALTIIEGCDKLSEYVFSTGRTASGGKAGAGKGGQIKGWGKAKAKLDALMLQKADAIDHERAARGIADWHLHDLRRTAATHLAKIGTDRIVISKLLNHAEGGVTQVYDRHRYDREKREALDAWSNRLMEIVTGNEGANVVRLSSVKR